MYLSTYLYINQKFLLNVSKVFFDYLLCGINKTYAYKTLGYIVY